MRLADRARRARGFTVIELLVVLTAIGLLLAVAAPRYIQHLDRARDVALRHDLRQLRDAIDKFYGDHARYPTDLAELVAKRYLREVPLDPVTQRSDTWMLLPPEGKLPGAVFDVRSGAKGKSADGTLYETW